MHIFFSGIGGAGIGPLSLVAHEAGYDVSGSDKQDSSYIAYLREHGVSNIHIGQSLEAIEAVHGARTIDWYVYSSALEKENPNHPELMFVKNNAIKHSKRDEFINSLIHDKQLALLAIAGTHGKTTTTAMLIWLFKQLDLPVSYSVGAKLSYGDMGEFSPESAHFVYECDEYDRNFLQFHPKTALISGIDYDHPDIFPTRDDYYLAFRTFITQSFHTIMWRSDAEKLGLTASDTIQIIDDADTRLEHLHIAGHVNRKNALLVAELMAFERGVAVEDSVRILNNFPGIARRFEVLIPGLVSDYAHTPKKIEGALQLAHEVAGENVVVVYEGLHNTRQHFIKDDLAHLFDSVKKLYVVPSYLAREDESLSMLSPADIIQLTSKASDGIASELSDTLKNAIEQEIAEGNLVVCFSAGGGGSLDEWLRHNFYSQPNSL